MTAWNLGARRGSRPQIPRGHYFPLTLWTHVLFISHILLKAAMQKFNESKQAGETVPEIPTKSTDNAESVNENGEENGHTSVDSRQSPTGESREDERDTVTPSAQVDGRFSEIAWLLLGPVLCTACIKGFLSFPSLRRRENKYHSWSGHVLFLSYHCCSSYWRDIILLSRQWYRSRLHVQVYRDATQVLLFLLFQTSSWGKQIFLICERHDLAWHSCLAWISWHYFAVTSDQVCRDVVQVLLFLLRRAPGGNRYFWYARDTI